MRDIEIGTLVRHPSYENPMVYDGPHEHPRMTRLKFDMRAGTTTFSAAPDSIVPADVEVPKKSPRVTAVKGPRTQGYGPKLAWHGYLDGEPVTGDKSTKREATRVALVTMAVRDFHGGN